MVWGPGVCLKRYVESNARVMAEVRFLCVFLSTGGQASKRELGNFPLMLVKLVLVTCNLNIEH